MISTVTEQEAPKDSSCLRCPHEYSQFQSPFASAGRHWRYYGDDHAVGGVRTAPRRVPGVLIASLRGAGRPTGHVNGFLRTVPRLGAVRLKGATPCMPGL